MSEALDAEKILASIVELRESIVELRTGIVESRKDTAELRESIAEQGKRMDEQGKRMDKMLEEFAEVRVELKKNTHDLADIRADLEKNNRKLDENTRDLAENNRKLDENNHRIGKLTNKLGSLVEKIVLPGIVDKFNEKGFKFDAVSANVEFLNEKKDGNIAEVDALLENGKFVIAVEAKTELTTKDVNAHIKRLQALHKISRFKGKKIYGAFSTAVVKPKPIKYALEKGFYVLQQPDAMAIRILDFPKGYSAKAW